MSELWSTLRPRLEYLATPLPLDALAEADTHRDELAPLLVAELAALAADPTPAQADGYVLHLYAMLLLARWRETRAYQPLAALGHLDESRIDTVFGQLVHASYGRALASTCDGDIAPLCSLADDPAASPWARAAALEALALAALAGRTARPPVIDFLSDFGRREARAQQEAPDEGEAYPFLEQLVGHLADLGAVGELALIDDWYAAGLIDEGHIDQARVEADIRRSPSASLAALNREGQGLIDDVLPEIAAWPDIHHQPPLIITPIPLATLRDPIVRDGAKVGRNDPCPCGSGRKYKHCHGAN